MKTNKKTFFAFAVALALFATMIFASALQDSNGNVILGMWYNSDANANTMTITDGDSVDFNVYALAVGSDLDVNVKLVKPGDDVVFQNFHRDYQNFNEFGIGSEGNYEITPDNYGTVGSYTIKLTVTGDESDSLTLYLNVEEDEQEPANGAPIFTSSPSITVNENEAYYYNAQTDDPEGDSVTYSLAQNPGWLSINSQSGIVTGTAPDVDSNTNYGVVVTASDGVNSANQAFDITVLDVPDSTTDTTEPTITITFPANTVYDTQIGVLNYNAVDAEGNLDECWYSTNLGVTNSTPVTCSGSFTINSAEGINRWTVYASDTLGNVGSTLITFTVDLGSDSDSDGSSSHDVNYVYEDPDQSRYESSPTVNPYINLAPSPESSGSIFARFIEAIINFFRWVFS